MKKALSLILSIALVFGIFASVPYTDGAFDFLKIKANAADASDLSFEPHSATIDQYFYAVRYCDANATGDLIIPSTTHQGYIVFAINSSAFSGCSKLTSITIPDSIEKIEASAFYGCSSLTAIIVDSANEYYCSVDGVLFNKEQTELIYYPAGKTDASYTIPETVTSVSGSAFKGCTNLESLTVSNGLTTIGGVTYSLNSDGASYSASAENTSISGNVSIVKTFNGLPVTTIPENAFKDCTSLNGVTIPDSVTTIGTSAFENANIEGLTIPLSVTSIGDNAFYNSFYSNSVVYYHGTPSQWANISIGSGNDGLLSKLRFIATEENSIDMLTLSLNTDGVSYAVTDCNEKAKGDIVIPATYNGLPVVEIEDSAFENCCYINSVVIPYSVTRIGSDAFDDCDSIDSIVIPYSVTSIGENAFFDCGKLSSITIPDSVVSIGMNAFHLCRNLKTVNITDLEAWCKIGFSTNSSNPLYYGADLYLNGELVTSLVIPETVTTIRSSAFVCCNSITSITIPDSVTSIGNYAFAACSALVTVSLPDKGISIGSSTFYNTAIYNNENNWENGVLYIGNHLVNAKSTDVYGEITIKAGTKSIADNAFSSCTRVTNVIFPDGLDYIGDFAFGSCTGLTSITIPDGVGTIGSKAFSSCTGVTSITIGDNVGSIGDTAFSGCKGVKSFTIGSGLETVGDSLFGYNSVYIEEINVDSEIILPKLSLNSSLKKATFGDNITAIPDFAFDGCTSLTEIKIPDSVTSIGAYAFRYCDSLTEIIIPDSVTSIGNYAFYDCDGLTEIVISDSVTSIGDYAFAYCDGITEIAIPDSVTSIGYGAFYNCSSLSRVTIGNGLTSYISGSSEEKPFSNCDNIEEVNINTDFALTLFHFGDNLKKVTLGNNVTAIPDNAFYDCDGLTEITIPDSVRSIGYCAFAYTSNLICINFPDKPIEISEGILEGAVYLDDSSNWDDDSLYIGNHLIKANSNSKFTVKDGTVSIAKYAIRSNCWEITLPESLKLISNGAFEYAEELDCVFFKGSQEQWEEITIGDNNDYLDDASYHFGMTSHTPGDEWFISDGYSCNRDGGYKYKKCTVCGGECEKEEISGHVFTDGYCDYCNVCQYSYTIEDGKVTITGVNYQRKEMIIPEEIEGCPVVAIGDNALSYSSSIGSVSIPDSVKTIGKSAFYGCSSLTAITIPASVTSISYYAFFECSSLAEVNLPQTAISIKADAFGLTAIYNDDSNWEDGAFYIDNHLIFVSRCYTSDFVVKDGTITVADGFLGEGSYSSIVKTFYIPDSVKRISGESFANFGNLTAINVAEGNQYYSSKDGVLFNKAQTELLRYPRGATAEIYVVPDSVTQLASKSFYLACVSDVILPDGLTKIGDSAFQDSTIKTISIPDGVRWIGSNVFRGTYRLKSVVLPENITEISEYAFMSCSSLEYIFYKGNEAQWSSITIGFYNTDLTEAFIHYNSTDHTASDWITDIEPTYSEQGTKHKECIFCGHTLENDYIPILSGFIYKAVDMSSYKLAAYLGMSTNVTVPTTNNNCPVTEIGEGCFKDNQRVTRVIIPIGVTKIGYLAFMNCKNLQYVAIPATVTEIGRQAFFGFEGRILCQEGSVAHQYAVDNGIDYVFPTIEAADSRSKVDFEYQMIYTSVANCTDITEIIITPPTMISLPVAKDGATFYGTGATITIFDGVNFRGDYTIIVQADMNGDGVCNVLDAYEAERMASGHVEASLEQIYAAKGEAHEEFTINDYQSVVNCALSA